MEVTAKSGQIALIFMSPAQHLPSTFRHLNPRSEPQHPKLGVKVPTIIRVAKKAVREEKKKAFRHWKLISIDLLNLYCHSYAIIASTEMIPRTTPFVQILIFLPFWGDFYLSTKIPFFIPQKQSSRSNRK